MCSLAYPNTGYCGGRKIRVLGFCSPKTNIQPQIHRKHHHNLVQPILNLQKRKKPVKNQE